MARSVVTDYKQRLRHNYCILGDDLDTKSGLISELYSRRVLSMREMQDIEDKHPDYKRNEALVNVLLQKSSLEFSHFLDALTLTKQDHMVDILRGRAACLASHVNFITPIEKVVAIEKEMALTMNSMIKKLLKGNNTADELGRIIKDLDTQLETFKSRLMHARDERSILIYVFCRSKDYIDDLKVSMEQGEVLRCIQRFVVAFVRNSRPEMDEGSCAIGIRIDDKDLLNCKQNFTDVSSTPAASIFMQEPKKAILSRTMSIPKYMMGTQSPTFDDVATDLMTLTASASIDDKLTIRNKHLEDLLIVAHEREVELKAQIAKLEKEKDMLQSEKQQLLEFMIKQNNPLCLTTSESSKSLSNQTDPIYSVEVSEPLQDPVICNMEDEDDNQEENVYENSEEHNDIAYNTFSDYEINSVSEIEWVYRLQCLKSFGECWLGRFREADVHVKRLNHATQITATKRSQFFAEARVLMRLNHSKVVRLLGVSTQTISCIILEAYSEETLLRFLRSKRSDQLQRDCLVEIAVEIASGMRYLEENKCIHRNLCAENILIGDSLSIKITNFESAIIVHDEVPLDDQTFDVRWTPPEVIKNKLWSNKSDIWSFGVLLYEIVTYGKTPFSGCNSDEEVVELVCSPEYARKLSKPDDVSCTEELFVIMKKCWHYESSNRPTFIELMQISCYMNEKEMREILKASYLARPILDRKIKGKKRVTGITVLNRIIYVIRIWSTRIEVYSEEDNDYNSEINVIVRRQRSDYFSDIISCDHHSVLFVSVYNQPLIHKIDPETREVTSTWNLESHPSALSLTPNRNVLVCCKDISEIQEYTQDGALIKKIRRNGSEDCPLHAIQIDDRHIAIIQDKTYPYSEKEFTEICMVNEKGDLSPGYKILKGKRFSYICYDKRYRHMLVVEQDKDRIRLIDKYMNGVWDVLNPDHGIDRPRSIHLSAERLYVGLQEGKILVYNISPPPQSTDEYYVPSGENMGKSETSLPEFGQDSSDASTPQTVSFTRQPQSSPLKNEKQKHEDNDSCTKKDDVYLSDKIQTTYPEAEQESVESDPDYNDIYPLSIIVESSLRNTTTQHSQPQEDDEMDDRKHAALSPHCSTTGQRSRSSIDLHVSRKGKYYNIVPVLPAKESIPSLPPRTYFPRSESVEHTDACRDIDEVKSKPESSNCVIYEEIKESSTEVKGATTTPMTTAKTAGIENLFPVSKIDMQTPITTHSVTNPVQIGKVKGKAEIRGIAMLTGCLFIIRIGSTDMEVYDPRHSSGLEFLKSVKIDAEKKASFVRRKETKKDFRDIASCSRNNCLYVTESDKSFVYKIHGMSYKITCAWKVRGVPMGISIIPGGNVFVSCSSDDQGGGVRFREFTCDGVELRDIMPVLQGNPRFGIQLDTTHFVVCCEEMYASQEDSVGNVVCLTNDKGLILSSSKHIIHYSGSVHIVTDSKGGILIADSVENKINLLDLDMNLIQEIVSSDQGVNNPVRIYFDKEFERLFVGLKCGTLLAFVVGSSVMK